MTHEQTTPPRPALRWMRRTDPPAPDANAFPLPGDRAQLLRRLSDRAWPLLLDCVDRHWAMETYCSGGDGTILAFHGAGGCALILETDTSYPRAYRARYDEDVGVWHESDDTNVMFGAWDDGIVETVLRQLDLPDPYHYNPVFTDPEDMPADLISEEERELLSAHLQQLLDTCFDLDALHADACRRMRDAADPQVLDIWRCIAHQCGLDPERLRLDDYTSLASMRSWIVRIQALAPELLWVAWLVASTVRFDWTGEQPVRRLREQVLDMDASRDDWRRLVRLPASVLAGMYERPRDMILPEILSILRASRLCGIDILPGTPEADWVLGLRIPAEVHAMVTCRGQALPRPLAGVVMREGIARLRMGQLEAFERRELSLLLAWLEASGMEAADPNRIRAGWPALWRQVRHWLASRTDDCPWSFAVGPCRFLGWTVQPIAGSRALRLEGSAMRHCAANYTGQCEQGKLRFFRATRNSDGVRVTLSLEHERGHWTVHALKRRANADPDAAALCWAEHFAEWYSEIARQELEPIGEEKPDGDTCPVCGGDADCDDHLLVRFAVVSGHIDGPFAAVVERTARALEAHILDVARGNARGVEFTPFVAALVRELRRCGSVVEREWRDRYSRWINLTGRVRSCVAGHLEHMDGVHVRPVDSVAEDGTITRENWLYAARPDATVKALATQMRN